MREICTFGSVRGGGGNIPAYSAQGVAPDLELAGIVAHDHGVGEQAVGLDAAPQGAFGGQPDRVRGHRTVESIRP